ncbi:uncharacterized protein BKA55DRAFT_742734 [Fusarium redolens]|uniref:Uncharacterized protein n=1 Tax=Fusarium redolens TaxID=48865 RepID=A0A9P9G6K6_FUSRE|nr:uncharacterized protein BKA55DRAFT_742734 [Fusarium redolens]KAH7232239.1 hypothetical protein BKA55DRAFT_742734 [Fusarium redolens]
MASMFEQPRNGTLFLGGQKISGSDIRDQNGDVMRQNQSRDLAKAPHTCMTTWNNKKTIKCLEKAVDQYKTVMETQILVRVCKRNDAIVVQQQKGFDDLSQGLQDFITHYAAGETQMAA